MLFSWQALYEHDHCHVRYGRGNLHGGARLRIAKNGNARKYLEKYRMRMFGMTYADEVRAKLAYALLIIGGLMLLFGVFADSSWGAFLLMMGGALFISGALMNTSLSIITGITWLVKLMSHHAEPVWDGEFIHTDGFEFKIRYAFDAKGSPWFVARDVCIAVGEKAPKDNELKRGGVSLLMHDAHISFSETNVQAYLLKLASQNHAAHRLLRSIRNQVLRQVHKQRDDINRYG